MHTPQDRTWYDIRPQISHLMALILRHVRSVHSNQSALAVFVTRNQHHFKTTYPKLVESGIDAIAALNFWGGSMMALLLLLLFKNIAND